MTATAQTYDSQLLDKLVANGNLSYSESTEIKKLSAEVPVIESNPEALLRISAKMQTQYEYINADCLNGTAQDCSSTINKFIVRRMILTFNSDNKREWGTRLSFDFILSNKMSITYIWHRMDNELLKGELRMGYLKTNFCYEENMSPFKLYAVERSIATYYWGGPRNARRLGFASFMTGAYWFGKSQSVDGLKYGCGVSNSENYQLGFDSISNGQNNTPNLWTSSSYVFNIEKAKFTVGLNLGWGADANKTAQNSTASIWGANPYISFNMGSTRAMSEFLVSGVDSGKTVDSQYKHQFPMGVNFAIEHKFDIGEFGKLAPVFRFTYLDTDGRGVTPSDGLRHTCNVSGDKAYTRARSFYCGVNWYLNGNSLKVQAGYEFSHFMGGSAMEASHALDANSVRSQIQILF